MFVVHIYCYLGLSASRLKLASTFLLTYSGARVASATSEELTLISEIFSTVGNPLFLPHS